MTKRQAAQQAAEVERNELHRIGLARRIVTDVIYARYEGIWPEQQMIAYIEDMVIWYTLPYIPTPEDTKAAWSVCFGTAS